MLTKCCLCSSTDVNGFLDRGQMFVLSQTHFQKMVEHGLNLSFHHHAENCWNFNQRLLDVGAGDGNVTQHLAPLFQQVVTTEVSSTMVYRLKQKGFRSIQTASLDCDDLAGEIFDVVSILNVLDRCAMPLSLLRAAQRKMRPRTGLLLLAVVFPFEPFVEGQCSELPPTENLAELMTSPVIFGHSDSLKYQGTSDMEFEVSVQRFIGAVLLPLGFRVLAVSRVPYLCKGDAFHNYFVLDNALFLCSVVDPPSPSSNSISFPQYSNSIPSLVDTHKTE